MLHEEYIEKLEADTIRLQKELDVALASNKVLKSLYESASERAEELRIQLDGIIG